MICRKLKIDDSAGADLMVSIRPNSQGGWIALDFDSPAGRSDGHDLTLEQADQLLVVLTEILTLAHAERGEALPVPGRVPAGRQ